MNAFKWAIVTLRKTSLVIWTCYLLVAMHFGSAKFVRLLNALYHSSPTAFLANQTLGTEGIRSHFRKEQAMWKQWPLISDKLALGLSNTKANNRRHITSSNLSDRIRCLWQPKLFKCLDRVDREMFAVLDASVTPTPLRTSSTPCLIEPLRLMVFRA